MALAKLAIEHFEKHQRPLRIAIDAAIWNFQTQSGQGGKNPSLRTLFFRLLKLLALPINPVFVYDGKNKPLTKRGKTVSRYGTCVPNELSKNLVARFQFPHHTAPGEAEAECAFLQKNGIVDAVMSQDVDAIMFGSALTLRDWSKEGTKGNKTPTHVNVFESARVKEVSGLDASGMVLVALLSGGDYHEGVQGFGPGLSCQIAKAGFGEELVTLVQNEDEQGLKDWRERLQYELETNESGYFLKRHRTVKISEDFPDRTVLGYYLTPAVSNKEDLRKLETRWLQWWDREIDIPALREYTAMTFDWLYKGGARKYVRCLAQPLFQHRLKRRQICTEDFSMSDITEKRKHFTSDGISELRLTAIPATVVGIDIEAEEENPEFADLEVDEELECIDATGREHSVEVDEPSSPSKRRKQPPWDPYKAEKWWIPEMILKTGMPGIVEAWHKEQSEIRADPLRFATRKCKPPAKAKTGKKIDHGMKDGAIENFIPIAGTGNTTAPPRAKKSLERAKTDTAVPLSSQQKEVGTYFKPSKSSKTASFLTAGSRIATLEEPEPHVDEDSDDGFDVDILDLLHKPSRSPPSWLTRSKDDHDFVDAAASPSVTVRKKKPQKTLDDTDDDIVYVGSKPLPKPIASFFSNGTKLTSKNPSERQFAMTTTLSIVHEVEAVVHEKDVAKTSQCIDPLPSTREVETVHSVTAPKNAAAACRPALEEKHDFAIALSQTDHSQPKSRNAARKIAVLRESLPGTWKELPLTPSQNSGVAFIDLTNT